MYKVMIVDDEQFILDGLRAIIDWEEYNLSVSACALDGEEAFSFFTRQYMDIVITDITMPRMNGLDLIRKIKKINSDVKFIILSGYSDFQYVKEGIKLGIENYLLKPINVEELTSTLTNTINKIETSINQELYSKNDLNILRNNILYRWATNNIDAQELTERAALLNLNLKYLYYTVSSIKLLFPFDEHDIRNNKKKSKLVSQALKICAATTDYHQDLICFCDLVGDLVFISCRNSQNGQEKMLSMVLNQVKEILNSKLHLNLFITVGRNYKSYLNVYKSYWETKELQNYLLLLTENQIIHYDEVKSLTENNSVITELDFKSFSKLLISKNTTVIFQFIDELFAKLQSSITTTPSDIQNCAIKILLIINRLAEELNLPSNTSKHDYKKLFSNLLKLQSIEQIIKSVKDEIIKFNESLTMEDLQMTPVIRQILNYINSNYASELSIKTLSQKLNINPTYLGQLFQKETGELFSNYVNELRIKKAKELLLTTNLKTKKIASRVGYSDVNYFYKKFKQYTGLSPTELRGKKKYLRMKGCR